MASVFLNHLHLQWELRKFNVHNYAGIQMAINAPYYTCTYAIPIVFYNSISNGICSADGGGGGGGGGGGAFYASKQHDTI